MLVLVVNCGSSSIKYKLMDMEQESVLLSGLSERIGIAGSRIKQENNKGEELVLEQDLPDHKAALETILKCITDAKYGAIKDTAEIKAVGHRVVHGGEKFNKSVVIDAELMKVLEEMSELAPLHNPPNIIGIKTCQELMPHAAQVAVFDTAFHSAMPKHAYTYAVPYEYYEKYKIRRYGFHGTSHKFVSHRAAEILGKPVEDLKIIVCHLGNGSSISAVGNGVSQDTSMGFTPLPGLPMGTRTGDMDPAIVPFLMEKEQLGVNEIGNVLNKKSGVLGVSGISSDFRDLEDAASKGNERAELALNMFAYGIIKYIGAYTAALGGLDAVVFTGGIGENSKTMRAKVLNGLAYTGLQIDEEKNNTRGKEVIVSKPGAPFVAMVVPTNEELMIARETKELV
ncbi:acetate kinase [Desulforamulus reducens MI-1]|uniref:Acetate kinase n=1 Tax=Desulforamulus reducens (strain ATCC BAA-1160 / DSM 100696 / MI-1) TaxID=349161 RepID=ACKA_DESRM|nr:acetate kinase [Desulforamulus reducens]A4J6A8.1 RecName: Full=Acetate kinase; AltName: Full=Acetokinase [Desulforamulus reducens MI-1]ABO50611.1 acetate kinase [Desulforamulus reducens MI-1]